MKREIEMLLLKMPDGERILRLSEPGSGLCLEKRLDPFVPVVRQKKQWNQVFMNLLEREIGTPS